LLLLLAITAVMDVLTMSQLLLLLAITTVMDVLISIIVVVGHHSNNEWLTSFYPSLL
jgi:hypothetical protein